MNDVRKGLMICFGIQGILIAVPVLLVVSRILGAEFPRLALWQLVLMYLANWFWCPNCFWKPFEKELQHLSPKDYNTLIRDNYFGNLRPEFLLFSYKIDSTDSHDLRKMRYYCRYMDLLHLVMFFQLLPWAVLML